MSADYDVPVCLERKFTGFITVHADDPEHADQIVRNMIEDEKEPLQTSDPRIEWDDDVGQYVDNTFDINDCQMTWRH